MQRQIQNIAVGIFYISLAASVAASPDTASVVTQNYEQKPMITADHAQAIYRHLVEEHWVPETGLFISFLGSGDHKLSQQASTYEQGAVGLLALRLGDLERAQGIFHFLKKAWETGPSQTNDRQGIRGLTNFYNAEFGGEGIEKTIHVGPNAWAGLFAARLGNQTGDSVATAWALELARWIAKDIPHRNGGVAMGPLYGQDGVPWPKVFSTENNLSYYALLSELLRTPDLAARDSAWLTDERIHVEDWLVTTAFDRLAYTMNRGVNPFGADRVRALDTITWLISAVGPERLKARGIDPDRLMQEAEKSFVVKTPHLVGVDPTDQPEADLTLALNEEEAGHPGGPRSLEDQHRMVWYEGLGQYINALNTMAAFLQKSGQTDKAVVYAYKSQEMTGAFDRAALKIDPNGSAYRYATTGKFFHDGWYSPSDSAKGPASSLIAAVWRCYAGLGMDPLAGNDIAGVPTVLASAPVITSVKHPRPNVLYGTSEDMVTYAWQRLNGGDTDYAILQAEAVIQEWSPWALKLEEKKARKLGHLVEDLGLPDQRKEIFSYWALNDVAAAYFIIGKARDQQHAYVQATAAFREIVQHYPLAQVWDPRGWFWSPVESIRDEYVARDPTHYRDILPAVLAASSFNSQPN